MSRRENKADTEVKEKERLKYEQKHEQERLWETETKLQ